MKLGMNMLLWGPDVTPVACQPTFELLQDLGYDGVEIPILDREVDKYAELGSRLEELGLERVAVAARMADDNPISADAAVRREAVQATKTNIDAAAALGATLMCGPLAAPIGVLSGAPPTAQERLWALDHLREVAPYAEERGITIALEYVARFEMYLTNTAADLAELVREVDHPGCRMMYDTNQAHIEEKDPRSAIEACKDVLVHVHLSESDRGTPGTGQVQWKKTFAALLAIGYDGWAMIEAFGLSVPEFASATRTWRCTFESEEQLARDGAAFVRAGLGF
jgi:D-psicose/D-tagatose/L-ribulose 3-epimerase